MHWALVRRSFVSVIVLCLVKCCIQSVATMFSLFRLECGKHCCVVSCFSSCLKSEYRSSVQFLFDSCFINGLMLSVFSVKFGMNFAKYCIAPRKVFRGLIFVEGFSFLISSVFSLFGLKPPSEIVCPSHTVSF